MNGTSPWVVTKTCGELSTGLSSGAGGYIYLLEPRLEYEFGGSRNVAPLGEVEIGCASREVTLLACEVTSARSRTGG